MSLIAGYIAMPSQSALIVWSVRFESDDVVKRKDILESPEAQDCDIVAPKVVLPLKLVCIRG